jgi:hypothetical protein
MPGPAQRLLAGHHTLTRWVPLRGLRRPRGAEDPGGETLPQGATGSTVTPSDPPSHELLATTTHARLRATQGDVRGARRILETVLLGRPDDPEALALLERLSAIAERGVPEEPEETPAPPLAADPAALRSRFRVLLGSASDPPRRRVARRLEAILRRIDERKRADDAR